MAGLEVRTAADAEPGAGDPKTDVLPEEVRALRRQYQEERAAHWESLQARQRREVRATVLQGAGTFLLPELVGLGWSFVGFGAQILMGALVGFLWIRLRMGVLTSALAAMLVYFGGQLALAAIGASQLQLVLAGPFIVGSVGAYLGLRREMRPYD